MKLLKASSNPRAHLQPGTPTLSTHKPVFMYHPRHANLDASRDPKAVRHSMPSRKLHENNSDFIAFVRFAFYCRSFNNDGNAMSSSAFAIVFVFYMSAFYDFHIFSSDSLCAFYDLNFHRKRAIRNFILVT